MKKRRKKMIEGKIREGKRKRVIEMRNVY